MRAHRESLDPLFRSVTATRFITEVGVRGPIFIKSLPDLLAIDKHHVFDLVRRFQALGVVVVNPVRYKPFSVELNQEFFLFSELRALLYGLARKPLPRRAHKLRVAGVAGIDRCIRLFGTRGRTLSIAWISELESINQNDLRKLIQVRDQSIRVLVLFWEGLGVVVSRKLGGERVLSLNASYPLAAELKTLLDRLHPMLPGAGALIGWQQHAVARRKGIDKITPATTAEESIPFGTATQRRLLALLAACDGLPVSAIAKTLGWTQDRVRGVGHSLRKNGLIASARVEGNRNGSLWFALSARPTVADYLRPLVSTFPRVNPSPHQLPLRSPCFRTAVSKPKLTVRLLAPKILTALSSGASLEDVEIARLVSSSSRLVRTTLGRLAATGVIAWTPVGGRAEARLNVEYPLYKAFVAFLKDADVCIPRARNLKKIRSR